MVFDCALLLAPVTDAEPCGPALTEHPFYDEFKAFSTASQRIDWARQIEKALVLAEEVRDLRAWVWLTRSSICVEGVRGLAAGLQLIADGLERYWDILPPQHANENDPAERYMMRLSALTQLGATHYACTLADLQRFGRNYTDLQADLHDAFARAARDQATRAVANEARDATGRICEAFSRSFGTALDPMLNFDIINTRLDEIAVSVSAVVSAETPVPPVPDPTLAPQAVLGAVKSRDDVIRALDLILAYYETQEPSSAVPLLLSRAKRLVPSTFMEALKDLAPAGLNDLLTIAGLREEHD